MSLESGWSEERISGGEGLVIGRGNAVLLVLMPARDGEAAYSVGGGDGGRGKNVVWCK